MARKLVYEDRVILRLPRELHDRLRALAGEHHMTLSAYIRLLLELDALRAKATGQ